MITIQEIHAYQNLVESGDVKPVICISNKDHGKMIPWINEDKPCFKCLACETKVYPSIKITEAIKKYSTK